MFSCFTHCAKKPSLRVASFVILDHSVSGDSCDPGVVAFAALSFCTDFALGGAPSGYGEAEAIAPATGAARSETASALAAAKRGNEPSETMKATLPGACVTVAEWKN